MERDFEAFEQGKLSPERCEQRLTRLQRRLDDRRAQEAELSLSTPHEAGQAPTAAELAAVADLTDQTPASPSPRRRKRSCGC